MAPHLTKEELGRISQLVIDGKTTSEIHRRIAAQRAKRHILPPVIEVIRRVVAGSTFRRGVKETRGRKRKWSINNARQANAKRIRLYKDAKSEKEVTWAEVLKKSRVPAVHPSTASRSLARSGIEIKARRPREKASANCFAPGCACGSVHTVAKQGRHFLFQ